MQAVKDWVTLHEDEVVLLRLEIHNGFPFLHCEVEESKWTKSEYKRMLGIWLDIMNELKSHGIDFLFVWTLDEQVTKFANMFGFRTLFTDEADQSLLFLKY